MAVDGIQIQKIQAFACIGAGRFQEAKARYAEICRLFPRDAEAWFLLGALNGQLGLYEESIECCRQAAALNPDYAEAHYNLAQAYMHQSKPEQAALCYREVVRLRPQHATAMNNLGYALQQLGRYEEAAGYHRQALQRQPDNVEILNNLGNALQGLQLWEEARECYRRALRVNPYYAEAHNNMGNVFRARKNFDAAVLHYREAVRLKPDYPMAYSNLGNTLQQLGRFEEAIQCYREALRLNPNLASVKYLLAALGTEPAPDKAPAEYVKEVFDGYAEHFEHHLVDVLEYQTPALLNQVLRRILPPPQRMLDVLDLGCGTGLCGPLLRDIARTLTGVDLSPRMLEKAREKHVYDKLLLEDITVPLLKSGAAYDLVVATDVFIYIGDLTPTFAACKAALKPDGLFAFSIETADECASYQLRDTDRYAHAVGYIRNLAKSAGLEEVSIDDVVLRKQHKAPVAGNIIILRQHG